MIVTGIFTALILVVNNHQSSVIKLNNRGRVTSRCIGRRRFDDDMGNIIFLARSTHTEQQCCQSNTEYLLNVEMHLV